MVGGVESLCLRYHPSRTVQGALACIVSFRIVSYRSEPRGTRRPLGFGAVEPGACLDRPWLRPWWRSCRAAEGVAAAAAECTNFAGRQPRGAPSQRRQAASPWLVLARIFVFLASAPSRWHFRYSRYLRTVPWGCTLRTPFWGASVLLCSKTHTRRRGCLAT